MARFHVHIAFEHLASSTRFHSAKFGPQPAVEKPDYAEWMARALSYFREAGARTIRHKKLANNAA